MYHANETKNPKENRENTKSRQNTLANPQSHHFFQTQRGALLTVISTPSSAKIKAA
jgi:hypothetical protein